MSGEPDPAAVARAIVDASLYLTLATADAGGRPWPTPVYFATADHQEFVWVSRPGARHSANLTARPQVGLVVFDSHAPIGTGRAVYASGSAGLVPDDEIGRCIDVFSRANLGHGGRAWGPDDVRAPAGLRLYRAVADEQWVLDEYDRRIALGPGLTP
jgi:hypothetical protein